MARRKARLPLPRSVFVLVGGTCFFCGCTDDDACAPGDYWVNSAHTLCSICCCKIGQVVMVAVGNLAEGRRP